MRLQKVASNEHFVLGDALTLTEVVTFRPSGRIKLVTGTPEKALKWCAEIGEAWASMSCQSVKVENGEKLKKRHIFCGICHRHLHSNFAIRASRSAHPLWYASGPITLCTRL